MTLPDYLRAFMEKRNMNKKDLMEQTKLNSSTVSRLTNQDTFTMFTVQRLVDTYGDEFKQFLEYQFCKICGAMFVPMTRSSVTCHKPECIFENAYRNSRDNQPSRKEPNAMNRAVDKNWKPKKPKVSIGEFNGMAKDSGKSYGELQQEFLCKGRKC